MKKKLLILCILIVVVGTGIYLYLYKGHRDISSETSDYAVTIPVLEQEYKANDSLANSKYLDKTITVSGLVTTIDTAQLSVVIDSKLTASFGGAKAKDFAVGNATKIKGRFIGYDDLLEEFRMDQVSIAE